jgi:hypothetical protein
MKYGKTEDPHGGGTAEGLSYTRKCQTQEDHGKVGKNRVGLVKLADGCYSESRRETLPELCRVHFPHSKLMDGSMDGQGQLGLGESTRKMNRGDWNLVRGMTDQYRIKWVIATFRPFK